MKYSIYGLVKGPLEFVMYSAMDQLLINQQGLLRLIGRLFLANVFLVPIDVLLNIGMRAIIERKRSNEIVHDLKHKYLPLLKLTWIMSPILQIIPFKFFPPLYWIPYFSFSSIFLMGLQRYVF